MRRLINKRWVFIRHNAVKIGIKKTVALQNKTTAYHIFAGQFIPWKVAPQQSLPPLELTMQSLHMSTYLTN